ncbi:MAG: hypothetical protein VBE63_21970 [Lamprobacter sp.]|uniref:hypothetical protein n=1 Tax=Lamprobacter sp. TaxID=3100796 RepID=UPI002B260FF4|nr:hypothetical protein [Lamprobacter sp.]MEA3642585.1 hypothetical protein [Lamprobacter sp.]
MANIPNARRYSSHIHNAHRGTTSATARPAQPDAAAAGVGWGVAATVVGLGVLYLVGGSWAVLLGGISLIWLLSS